MPEVRAASGAAAIDGKIYVAGGVGPDDSADSILVFDIAAIATSTRCSSVTIVRGRSRLRMRQLRDVMPLSDRLRGRT